MMRLGTYMLVTDEYTPAGQGRKTQRLSHLGWFRGFDTAQSHGLEPYETHCETELPRAGQKKARRSREAGRG